MTRRRTLRSVRSPSSPSPEDVVVNEVIIDLLSGGSRPGGFAGGFPLLVLLVLNPFSDYVLFI
jgi:hypothetical protein